MKILLFGIFTNNYSPTNLIQTNVNNTDKNDVISVLLTYWYLTVKLLIFYLLKDKFFVIKLYTSTYILYYLYFYSFLTSCVLTFDFFSLLDCVVDNLRLLRPHFLIFHWRNTHTNNFAFVTLLLPPFETCNYYTLNNVQKL